MSTIGVLLKPTRYTASLPPTPCTAEMKQQVLAIAKAEAVSLAQIQRTALSLFLIHFEQERQTASTETNTIQVVEGGVETVE